jgi:hypothetical protein
MPTTTTERKTTPPTVLPTIIFILILFGDEFWGGLKFVESKVRISYAFTYWTKNAGLIACWWYFAQAGSEKVVRQYQTTKGPNLNR